MNYVDSLNILGVEVKEIPCIKGAGAPTTTTEGAVGLFYIDTDEKQTYVCIAANAETQTYTWAPFGLTSITGTPTVGLDVEGSVSGTIQYCKVGAQVLVTASLDVNAPDDSGMNINILANDIPTPAIAGEFPFVYSMSDGVTAGTSNIGTATITDDTLQLCVSYSASAPFIKFNYTYIAAE